ncbi:MAG: hypothetical protein N2Z80_06995 [Hydrogenothermaceae bacterium]|nr:hypothetical protein [Hydrogenothermaceae bacterium]
MFVEISGYDEGELIGANHNIVCHPDMQRTVFRVMADDTAGRRGICLREEHK